MAKVIATTVGDGDGVWRTVNGRRIFIKKGQSASDAMAQSLGTGNAASGGTPRDRINKSMVTLKEERQRLALLTEKTKNLPSAKNVYRELEDFQAQVEVTMNEGKAAKLFEEVGNLRRGYAGFAEREMRDLVRRFGVGVKG